MVSVDIDIGQSPLLTKLATRGLPTVDELKIWGAAIAAAALFYALIIAIYRLYFHPLSKYPGPRLAAITSLYFHYHVIRGDIPHHTLRMHTKYGPVVRSAPDQVVYIDGAAWKDIYGHRTAGKEANRRVVTEHAYPGHHNLIQSESEENHSRQRRIFSHAFSEQSLRKQEPMFKKYVDQLISNLNTQQARAPGKPFNLVDHYNFATFDVMGDLTFSESLGMLEDSEYSPWVKQIFQNIKSNALSFVMRQYSLLGWLAKKTVYLKSFEDRSSSLRFSEQRVDRRLQSDTEKPDIWNLVLSQKGDRVLTKKEMYANASMFMIAGTETTATLLSGLTYWLLRTPEAMKKLRAELDEAFPAGRGITSEKLASAKYLNACLEEALRIYPPVPQPQLRITPASGATILGDFVPGNTYVGISQWSVNHSETNFALPNEYHPERWLDSGKTDPRFINDNRSAKQSFSVGPRNCLGRNMAWYEMRLLASQMVLTFDMELDDEKDDWMAQKSFSLWSKKPLMVRLTPREGVDTLGQ